MPHYYFNIRNGSGLVPDEEGRDLADAAQAHAEAVKGIRSVLGEEAKQGHLDLRGRIEVNDEAGAHLFHVRFREAVVLDDRDLA